VEASALARARSGSAAFWLALATIYLVWGSTYLAIRVMVETIPPFIGAGVRFVGAGLVFYGALVVRRRQLSFGLPLEELIGASVVGILLLLGGNTLVTVAERDIQSGLAALIVATIPLWVILLRLVARDGVARGTLIGVVGGFAGVAILVLPGHRPGGAPLGAMLLTVLAASLWAAGSFLSTRLALPRDPFVSTAIQMLVAGVAIVVAGLIAGEAGDVHLSHVSGRSVAGLLYLIFAGSLLAFTAYVWLLQNAPISTVATYAYVNPVVAVFLGWLILSEVVTSWVLAATVVIVASVAFVVWREGRSGSGGRMARRFR
jgi:drug/metabolite transporter (DMT)-like permease